MPSVVFRLCCILCTLPIYAMSVFASDQNKEPTLWTAKKAVHHTVQNNPDIRIAGIRITALHALQSSLQVARAPHEASDLFRPHLLDLEVQEARAEEDLIQTLPEAPDYSARPELQSIAAAVASARSALQMARAASLPAVDGFAGYQYENGFITNGDGNAWIRGIRMSYSLFDGGRKESEVALQTAMVAELEETKRKTELLLNHELQQTEQEVEQAEKRVAVTAKMVQLPRERGELSRARFREGVLLSAELIDIETRLTDALLRDSRAQPLYRTAAANLGKTVAFPQFKQ